MTRTALLFLAFTFAEPALAQQPSPNFDQLVKAYQDAKVKTAAAQKDETAALAALQAEWKRIADIMAGFDIPPPQPVDAFTQAVQNAYTATPANEKVLAAAFASVFKIALPYVDTDADTGTLFNRMLAGRKAVIQDGQLVAVRKAVDTPLAALMGPQSQPFTSELRAAVKSQMQRTIEILGKVK